MQPDKELATKGEDIMFSVSFGRALLLASAATIAVPAAAQDAPP